MHRSSQATAPPPAHPRSELRSPPVSRRAPLAFCWLEAQVVDRPGGCAGFEAVADKLSVEGLVDRSTEVLRLLLAELLVLVLAGAGRDQLADDDVFLEAAQAVDLAGDRRLGQYPRGLLEARRRQPAG